MPTLREALAEVEGRRKRLEVYTDDGAVAGELQRQFAVYNVDVDHWFRGRDGDGGCLVVRDGDGVFRGAVGLDHLEAILSPTVHPPWTIDNESVDVAELFDFLENTVFASYDRRQLLGATREFEARAWRVGAGRLYAGFQRREALVAQRGVYERLAERGSLSVTAFVADEWTDAVEDMEGVRIVDRDRNGVAEFWFVVFDGDGSDLRKCALVAEERGSGTYAGFWTYDPATVDGLVASLESLAEDVLERDDSDELLDGRR
ncbi:DICT sensory domain-containing protein [Natrarchaeobaculum sulfurireducens]|uniref:Sensor protein n=1 Tax=Natrarchaeobaculum sulfurireducens TaxID=2044521 RepID=A0A346PS34_9EURY|nr:DICT sensory domain-containing protein [Natrarchaeobaculum sulfurireducens]AXR77673.1 Sensor protein [Natrarchaeobaculum sulfurireducens]AXR82329.1 hypothetical protein AArcMg_2335 [Natrarchaeobaculum sulfurireducens]